GNGRFKDVTDQAGVASPGFATSAAWFDYDHDGKLDLIVDHYVQWTPATDQTCSLDGKHKSYCTPELYKGESIRLYHNEGNGRFMDVTKAAGLYDPSDKALGVALYHNDGQGLFSDQAMSAGIALPSSKSLTFSTFFFDYNLDGLPDIFALNGHVADDISTIQPSLSYAEPPLLFRNLGRGRFENASQKVGSALTRPVVGRGAAYADIDNDG